jgi:hypothetical protein
MKFKLMFASAVLLSLGATGHASTGQAWSALDRQVTRACIAASGLTRAEVQAAQILLPSCIAKRSML